MIISKILNLIKKNYHILFFIFLSSWILFYQGDGILSLGDFVFPIRPWVSLYSRFFIWKDFALLGHSDAIDFVNIIHYLPIALLNDVGLSIATIQSLFFIFLFFTASYSFYLLLYEILGDFKYKRMVAIIAANFYIFNPYVFAIKLLGYNMTLYIYSFVPLILFLFYKYLKTENYLKNKFIYLIGLCFLLSAPANTQPAYISWIILVLALYVIFFSIFKKFNKTILLKSFLVGLLFVLINLFWIIPSVGSGMFANSLSEVKNINNIDEITGNSAQSLNEVFRFLGMSGFNSSWRGVPYFPYHQIYYSSVFIIIGFILLFIALLSCLFKERNRNEEEFWKRYFISIFLISIFFIGGIVILFPEIKLWLFNKFAILLMYRKPYEKLGFFMIFSFSGLLAFSLKNIISWVESQFFKYKYKKIIIFGFLIFVLLLVNIYSFPFWTKQVFNSNNQKECIVKNLNYYPDYYYELGEYLKNNKIIGKIVGLPVNNSPISSGVEAYTWGYIGMDPIYSFISDSYVLFNPQVPFFNEFYAGIDSNKMNPVNYKDNLVKVDNLFNVKGNILRNNICWQLYNSPNPELDKKYLENNFNKILSFGELDLFKVGRDNFSPIFKVFSKINTKLETQAQAPVIEFKKINPTKYRVVVHRATGNFPLIFSESFHEGWRVYNTQVQSSKSKVQNLSGYKILDGNSDDQVNREELADYINNGLVSDLGDGKEKEIKHEKWENGREKLDYIEKYNIDFISKNFQGTIQNDNLSEGRFWETWFPTKDGSRLPRFARNDSVIQLSDTNHLTVNGYANSWIIETDKICGRSFDVAQDDKFCVKNSDGTYDFELVVEFWPQRLFYIGLFISGTTLLSCLIYLGWVWRRDRKVNSKYNADI